MQPHMATFDLQPQHLMAIIDGMEMDLNQSRYLDFNGLKTIAGMWPVWSGCYPPVFSGSAIRKPKSLPKTRTGFAND
jgi:hypothetical protein